MITKIKATFAAMKKQRKILFKIIFFLVVFFSIGIDTHSNNLQLAPVEIPAGTNNVEISFSPEIDSIDEDQIAQSYRFDLKEESVCQISIPRSCSIVYCFCCSVWQPPKIC
ncbi:MAG: hypothetical protein NT144_12430 [Bacteroidia bacterium]|nr:hypothetical protein [Bacteroidia bacterium]